MLNTYNLRREMYAQDYSQAKLAKALRISPGSMQAYISGKTDPKINIVQRMSFILNCDILDLLREERSKKNGKKKSRKK